METKKIIYVLAPYAAATGGVELAHQLVDYLRNNDVQAYIVYVRDNEIVHTNSITTEYLNYNIEVATRIEDEAHNILVLPEIYYNWIKSFNRIMIACWWMSVDNYYSTTSSILTLKYGKGLKGKLRFLKRLFNKQYRSNNISLLRKEGYRITHFYQSHYAQQHLYSLGFSRILPLSDYINDDYIDYDNRLREKKNIILYNPAKGYSFTKKIIEYLSDYEFVPLKGLTRVELKELLRSAKLYIDFGHFPGKDRLPREAILNDCCIITGNLGASRFYEDVPILQRYKFEACNKNLKVIANKIRDVIENYEDCIHDFEFYKNRIQKEKNIFHEEIKEAFIDRK